jgi:hypothetical protein
MTGLDGENNPVGREALGLVIATALAQIAGEDQAATADVLCGAVVTTQLQSLAVAPTASSGRLYKTST